MAPIKINGYHHGSLADIPQQEDPDFDTDYILVECQQHLTPADIAELEAAGAKVLTRQGNDDTYLCRHTNPVRDGLRGIEALPFVKVARVYHESLVISPRVIETLEGSDGIQKDEKEGLELGIHLHSCEKTGADIFQEVREHIDPDAKTVMQGDTFVRVKMRLCLMAIQATAKIDHVRFIGLPPVHAFGTYIATKAMVFPLDRAWSKDDGSPRSFWGDGEVVGVIDSGFADGTLTGHNAFQTRVIKVDWADPALQDPTKPASLPAATIGHGTGVAACALGAFERPLIPNAVIPPNRARCSDIIGPAAQARLYAVRVSGSQNKIIVNRDAIFKTQYEAGKVPRIWNASFNEIYKDPMSPKFDGYTPEANQTDAAANLDLEQIIVQNAGNNGVRWPSSPAGKRVFCQIGDVASAKNVITVGATANNRWQYLVNKKFAPLTNPSQVTSRKAGLDSLFVDEWAETDIAVDPATGQRPTWDQVAVNFGCISRIASMSSKGPTEEGRIKPDLVCSGFGLLTVKSPVAPPATGFEACPYDDYKWAGGNFFRGTK